MGIYIFLNKKKGSYYHVPLQMYSGHHLSSPWMPPAPSSEVIYYQPLIVLSAPKQDVDETYNFWKSMCTKYEFVGECMRAIWHGEQFHLLSIFTN